jgi:hypothetical protein
MTSNDPARAVAEPAAAEHRQEDRHGSPRSAFGSVPGEEFPTAVYASAIGAFALILLASWIAFGTAGTELDLGVAFALALIFFALPVLLCRLVRPRRPRVGLGDFLSSRVEIGTGTLTGFEAWLQVLIIPLALAFAAVAIGAVYAFIA